MSTKELKAAWPRTFLTSMLDQIEGYQTAIAHVHISATDQLAVHTMEAQTQRRETYGTPAGDNHGYIASLMADTWVIYKGEEHQWAKTQGIT
jgi:hypothetical protein